MPVAKPVPTPTRSYWHTRNVYNPSAASSPLPIAQAPLRNLETDVVVIGAGITGCSLAHHLMHLDPDIRVALVDSRRIAGGATGRNGGLLWPCLNASLRNVIKTKGREAAVDILRFEEQAASETRAFIEQDDAMKALTEYSPFRDGGLMLFESEEEARSELEDLSLMRDLGFGMDLEVWDSKEASRHLGTGAYFGAIRFPQVARVWAARLALGLAMSAAGSASSSGRLQILEEAGVTGISEADGSEMMHSGGASLQGGGGAVGKGADYSLLSGTIDDIDDNGEQGHPIARDSPFWAGGSAVEAGRRTLQQQQQTSAVVASAGGGAARSGDGRMAAVREVPPAGRSPSSGISPRNLKLTDSGADRPLTVRTSRGGSIRCGSVVHCTNAYSSALLPKLEGKLVPIRNQVAVTEPLTSPGRSLPLDAAVYAREGYVYFSPRSDGRIVLGGFRDVLPHREVGTFDDGSLDPIVSQSLRAYLPERFPHLYGAGRPGVRGGGKMKGPPPELEMEWSGILGFTLDRFPLVGKLPPAEHNSAAVFPVLEADSQQAAAAAAGAGGTANAALSRRGQYICAGFSGHGMTRAFSCAEGLARALLSERNGGGGLVRGEEGKAPLPASFLPVGGRI